MPTTRAQVAEDRYFRTQETERRGDEAWDRQRAAIQARVERHRAEASSRAAAREGEPRASEYGIGRSLNRLIVAGWDECLAFEEATRLVAEPGQVSLRRKLERRRVFRSDLGAAVARLGGEPARGCSPSARWRSWLRAARRLFAGPHEGDAYAACFSAAEAAAAEYSHVLASYLPGDVRFGIESQYAEVALDCQELRRLRWGANIAANSTQRVGVGRFPSLAPDPVDVQALEAWSNEGGASGKAGATGRGPGPG